MKENNLDTESDNQFSSELLADGKHNVEPCIKPPRVIFTKGQIETIGTINNGLKPLYKQKRLFEVWQYIINSYMIRSNGGVIPTEINQKSLLDVKVKGKLLNAQIITRAIQFSLDNGLLIKHMTHAPGKNSIFYIGGQLMKDYLDPNALKQEKEIRWVKTTWEKYRLMGYDPDERHVCKCCTTNLKAVNFKIWEKDDCLSPVCNSCWYINPAAAKSAIRAFKFEQETQIIMDYCAKQDEGDLDYQVEVLLKEMGFDNE